MGRSCILTDNAAQFTRPIFSGYKNLLFLEENVEIQKDVILDLRKARVSDFPKHVNAAFPVRLLPLSPEEIKEKLHLFSQTYDDIFILLVSRDLHPIYNIIEDLIQNIHGRATIHLLDTQSVAIGEGQIIQIAADLVEKGGNGMRIEEQLRVAIPHVYTLLSTPNYSYLYNSGFLDLGQAVSGEILSFLPIFNLEDGKLNPVEKVKNVRNVIDYFIEFIDEFEDISNISMIQPSLNGFSESKLIRQHIDEFFPETSYSEHPINPFLASLIGPQGTGIIITESISL